MSKNFFAALDDSDNEGEAPKVVIAPKKTEEKKTDSKKTDSKKSASAAVVVEPSALDRRRQPQNNDRNTKHGRGGRAPARDGKRAYDRRSGTGRGKEIKKDGGGAHNWGSDKNDARNAEGIVLETTQEEGAPKDDEQLTTKPEDEAVPEETAEVVVVPEEEDKTLTLEEYLANKARPESELFVPIQEREVENEFANIKPKVAVEEDFLVMGGTKGTKKKGPKTVEKPKVDVGFRVVDPLAASRDGERRGGGRSGGREGGGRGGGRGRSGGRDGERRGGGRSGGREGGGSGRGRGSSSSGGRGSRDGGINFNDASAFPSL